MLTRSQSSQTVTLVLVSSRLTPDLPPPQSRRRIFALASLLLPRSVPNLQRRLQAAWT